MADLAALTVKDLYRLRLEAHIGDRETYRGRPLVKFPEDLRLYQKVIEAAHPEVIVEIGSYKGGSALWFADQLRALCGGGRVISVDINPVEPVDDPDVSFGCGDATDPAMVERVRDLVGGASCMVVEDSAHTYDVTTAVLGAYAPMVTPGQWLVVEDGICDDESLRLDWMPRGVSPALNEFVATDLGRSFKRHWLGEYILTCHPGGWLQRKP